MVKEAESGWKLAAPALFLGVACMLAMPVIHPNNTCRDWLEKWGQLHEHHLWLESHQVATLGFAIIAGVFLMLPFLGRPTRLGILSSSAVGLGSGFYGAIVLLHATTISTIGVAYNEAADEQMRVLYRTLGTAVVNYDAGMAGVIAVLISGGMIGFTLYLRQLNLLSVPLTVVLAGAGSLWVAQYYGILAFLHIPTTEWSPIISFCLWLGAIALLFTVPSASSASGRVSDSSDDATAQTPP